MDEPTSRLLHDIEKACARYATGAISLPQLQALVEPVADTMESKDAVLLSALRHCVAQLEYIRFMYDDGAQLAAVQREIEVLEKLLHTRSRTVSC